jgi:hypothetical protein
VNTVEEAVAVDGREWDATISDGKPGVGKV